MQTITKLEGMPTYSPEDTANFMVERRTYEGKEVDVIFRKGYPGKTLREVEELRASGEQVPDFSICAEFNPRTYTATQVAPHIICDQDVPCILKDGTTIYSDIYRPANAPEQIPVIICWGPFGKRPHEGQDGWKLMGVPPQTVSEMAKFEAADPGYWCRYGYGVANVDPRGIGNSEGNVNLWGIEDGKDGYDYIEWIAGQPWCNGRVTLFGNSGVCMVIWRIAAEQPPHLACIAAWEGTGNMYTESLTFNGIPRPGFENGIVTACACKNWVEDLGNMYLLHPFYDEFWRSKTPRWERIRVPAYVCGGMCHFHLRGSCVGFRKIRSPKKWLRLHRDMEWPDTYNPDNLEDLRRFYDRYLKDVRNGWEFTPRVRVDVMDAYDFDYIRNKPEKEFPIKRTRYTRLYLNGADGSMSRELPAAASEVVYDNRTGMASFSIIFHEDVEIIGYSKLHLFVEARGYDNMDLFVFVKKYNEKGEFVPIDCMGFDYRGAWGQSRASRRELDPKESTDFQPVMAHQKDEPMEAGCVYEVDVEIHPHARIWHKGEEMRVEISPEFIKTDWYEDHGMNFYTDNGPEGAKHVIHTGGEYASYLQIPVIPPKYTSGEYRFKG